MPGRSTSGFHRPGRGGCFVCVCVICALCSTVALFRGCTLSQIPISLSLAQNKIRASEMTAVTAYCSTSRFAACCLLPLACLSAGLLACLPACLSPCLPVFVFFSFLLFPGALAYCFVATVVCFVPCRIPAVLGWGSGRFCCTSRSVRQGSDALRAAARQGRRWGRGGCRHNGRPSQGKKGTTKF